MGCTPMRVCPAILISQTFAGLGYEMLGTYVSCPLGIPNGGSPCLRIFQIPPPWTKALAQWM